MDFAHFSVDLPMGGAVNWVKYVHMFRWNWFLAETFLPVVIYGL